MIVKNKFLKIVTWNANSINSKLLEFKDFLCTNNYDIAGICETKIDNNYKSNLSNFNVYTSNRNSRGGGVAIAIKNNINHTEFKLTTNSDIEGIGIKITINSIPLYICQVYIPPNAKLNSNIFSTLFCYDNMIIMGDLNCIMCEWNCPTENLNGKR